MSEIVPTSAQVEAADAAMRIHRRFAQEGLVVLAQAAQGHDLVACRRSVECAATLSDRSNRLFTLSDLLEHVAVALVHIDPR